MNLHIYIVTWNNAEVLKDTLTWYRNLIPCNVTVYDNMSTDFTTEVCKEFNCERIPFNTNNEMDEKTLMNIRELCWLNPTHNEEWVLVCDDDEMGMVTKELLEKDFNVCHFTGYELFGEEGDTLEDMRYGLPSVGYSKRLLFRKDQINRMNFGAGSHNANPEPKSGFEIKYNDFEVPLYHTKWARGWEKGVSRQKNIGPRVSQHSKKLGWNFHFGLPDKLEEGKTGLNHWDYFNEGFKNRTKVR